MDLLTAAVVDITSLVAACHALVFSPEPDASAMPPKLRRRLRREIKRGTVAYIDTLARTKKVEVDDTLVDACRVAAERQMAQAVEHQGLLREIMLSEAGSLTGLAAARQDLWRLAHLAIHLRGGVATLLASSTAVDANAARSQARHLRRRLRKALIAYARATLRIKAPQERRLASARAEALAALGRSGASAAQGLAEREAGSEANREANIETGIETGIEARSDPSCSALRLGVSKPLADLLLDWRPHEPSPG